MRWTLTYMFATFIVSRIARADMSTQTDCSSPPIPWADVQESFWEKGYAIVTPCVFAGESSLLNAVHDYAVAGCKWAEAAKAGKNFPGRCSRKSNQWRTVASIHDAAVSEETRKMVAYVHGNQELPIPYQTITRTAPAIIKPHSDVIFWDTLPRARSVGTWLALEDIHEDSGPLEIYPKSHRESLWDEYELGLPCAAKSIDAAIASSSDNRSGFLQARQHAAIPSPKPTSRKACKPSSGASCAYWDVMERIFSTRKAVTPNLRRGQMLLWAASLVHQSLPPRNRSLTRGSFVTHYMWNMESYWRPTESKDKVHYVPKTMMQIPIIPYKNWTSSHRRVVRASGAGSDIESMAEMKDMLAQPWESTHSEINDLKAEIKRMSDKPQERSDGDKVRAEVPVGAVHADAGTLGAKNPATSRMAARRATHAVKANTHAVKADSIIALDSEVALPDAADVVAANRAAKRSVFIVGASRGVGLGLAKVYAASGYMVHATTRTLSKPGELGKVPGIRLYQLDVLSSSDIAALRAKADTGVLGPISTVIHNAAVKNYNLTQNMLVNSQAPFLVADALLPAVLLSSQKKLCIITSDMGSHEIMLHQKPSRRKWPYTISKKAANERFREREPGWRAQGITAVVMHPGFVKTGMSGGFGNLTPLESAASIKRTLEGTTHADAGKFFDYNGKVLPW